MRSVPWSRLARRHVLPAALGALLAALLAGSLTFAQPAPPAPYCAAGQSPAFALGFAALQARVGEPMGAATSCEYGDPNGTGDTHQQTSTGLSFYRQRTNTPTFTDGYHHWALTADGLVTWEGDSIDPPGTAPAAPVASPTPTPTPPPTLRPLPPTPVPSPTPVPTPSATEQRQQVLALVNAERARAGLAPVRVDPRLERAAQDYADLMLRLDCYAHNCDGRRLVQRTVAAGYPGGVAEALGGRRTAERTVVDWMDSPPHRHILLLPDATDIGVGYAAGGSPRQFWWVLEMGAIDRR